MELDRLLQRSDVEETETQKTKASDSGYSNSCSNSQSQRSSGSSKSRNSTSSGSSGFGPHQVEGEKQCGKRKEKDAKKKKDKDKDKDVPSSSSSTQKPVPIIEAQPPVESTSGVTTHSESVGGSETLQTVALSQTFTTMKRIKTNKEQSPDVENSSTEPAKPVNAWTQDEMMQLVGKEMTHEVGQDNQETVVLFENIDKASSTVPQQVYCPLNYSFSKEELGVVVSMDDGLVIYTTTSLTQVLGYPKDMWIGRSLIDFVHPRHRASFAGHITSIIASTETNGARRNHYSCYLRQYRGLRNSGFSVIEKWVGYLPFQLSMSFQETEDVPPCVYLVISAVPIRSAYKNGDETRMSTKFTTRHTASSQLCHVDPEVTPYFGYLPQDIIGRSILEFYHPEDLHFLKEVYEAVMKEQGHLFRSKPYRFRCQNGGFVLVETELSSFINPWSRKLEFIICQHTVLRGPPNPDVTTPVSEPEAMLISEEVLKETKIVQEEIKCLLNETVVRSCETAKQQVTKRCKDLAAFMENLMDELTKPPNFKVDVPTEEQSFSERDSVMLGEISPHHEYYDSKSSSETPPSYNQLNYNENLQRFFESKPKTTVSEDSTDTKSGGGSAGEEGKISTLVDSSGGSKSGGEGGSSGAQSTESSGEITTNGSNNNSTKNYKPATLTEQLLSRKCANFILHNENPIGTTIDYELHNEDMEKQMVQKHRESRAKSDRDTKIKDRMKTSLDKGECSNNHGIKRSGSHSWEGEPYKSIKAAHNSNDNPPPVPPSHEPERATQIFPAYPPRTEFPPSAFASTLMPMYYMTNRRPDIPLFSQQMPYVPSMVYHPVVFSPQPMVYSPVTVIPTAEIACPPPPPSQLGDIHSQVQVPPDPQNLPSTSFHNKETNDTLVQDQKTDSNETSVPFDDSSSSFYSLLKTDKSDESLRSSSENDTKQEVTWHPGKREDTKLRPIKKVPPWVEDINVTPELILKYQLRERPLEQVLSQDLQALESINQPELVSEQLSQMYLDLEVEGLSHQLMLDESSSSSESSGDESKSMKRRQKRYMEYDQMVILFEEDAPLPPPIAQGCT